MRRRFLASVYGRGKLFRAIGSERLYLPINRGLESAAFVFGHWNISFIENQNVKKRSNFSLAYQILKINTVYVPVSQLERYSSISGVNSSIVTPIARSFKLAIS